MIALRQFAAPVVALCLGAGVVGCSSEPRAEQVPAGAQLLVQGDQDLSYTATRDGEVFVYDATDETLIYRGEIDRGKTISVDPEDDKVLVDGKLVLEKDIHAGNRHRIYFQPDRDADRVVEERTTVREERTAGDRIERRRDDDSTTIRREETKHIDTDPDGDVTVKKETTVKTN